MDCIRLTLNNRKNQIQHHLSLKYYKDETEIQTVKQYRYLFIMYRRYSIPIDENYFIFNNFNCILNLGFLAIAFFLSNSFCGITSQFLLQINFILFYFILFSFLNLYLIYHNCYISYQLFLN